MCASLQEQKRQFHIVLLPCHQPVWLDVALPGINLLIYELMRVVLRWQRTSCSKQGHNILDELDVQSALFTSLQVLIETIGIIDAIHTSAEYLFEHFIHAVSMVYPSVFHIIHRLTIACRFGNVIFLWLCCLLYFY